MVDLVVEQFAELDLSQHFFSKDADFFEKSKRALFRNFLGRRWPDLIQSASLIHRILRNIGALYLVD